MLIKNYYKSYSQNQTQKKLQAPETIKQGQSILESQTCKSIKTSENLKYWTMSALRISRKEIRSEQELK